ncbi:MAG: helix-turn-helix domain-containing protein [Limnochordia bacterium]|nr:helix-turn-helix domain-containing protein [Limnochordia bacterium]
MSVAERIQNLRKTNGLSQEALADNMGVSRQAVSKWESQQSLPDLDKIILLSEIFCVTTDYLLRGIEPERRAPRRTLDARVFTVTATGLNFIGLVIAILLWLDKQTLAAVAAGLVIMAMGCMLFSVGQLSVDNWRPGVKTFLSINVWFLSLMPISSMFNAVQGTLGGYSWTLSPVPQLGNSYTAYWLCWFVYLAFCVLVDVVLAVRKGSSPTRL